MPTRDLNREGRREGVGGGGWEGLGNIHVLLIHVSSITESPLLYRTEWFQIPHNCN